MGTRASKMVVSHFFECQPHVRCGPRGKAHDLCQRSYAAKSVGFNFSARNVREVKFLKDQLVKITHRSDLAAFFIRKVNGEDIFGSEDQFHRV